ncbi:DEAD/DEAH box helicase family protein [Escherichia coli]
MFLPPTVMAFFRDATAAEGECLEKQITLDDFPSPAELWQKFCLWKGYTQAQLPVITQDYYDDGSGKSPRYYQLQAINKTIEAVSNGQNRVLLVMATKTGKPLRIPDHAHCGNQKIKNTFVPCRSQHSGRPNQK